MDDKNYMKVCILTRRPYTGGFDSIFLKNIIKNILKIILYRDRGPSSVLKSLVRGFKFSKNFELKVNPNKNYIQVCDVVHVLSDMDALEYVIKMKRNGVKKKLIAGPNLVLHPLENNNILNDEMIDVVLLPSEWTKKLYSTVDPGLSHKIKLWPAGISIPTKKYIKDKKKINFIVYKKNVPSKLFEEIIVYLNKFKYDFKIVEYGKYKKKHYFKLLEDASFMIYLQESESQGIALAEAWGYNVPTLVWDRGYVFYQDIGSYLYKNISCPYLSEDNGMSFSSIEDFKVKFFDFISHEFDPYDYVRKNLSDSVSIKIYNKIILNCMNYED